MQDVSEWPNLLGDSGLTGGPELLRLLLDSTAEAIYGLDLDGRCTFCNGAALRLLGFSTPEDLLGRQMHALIHHSHADGRPYPRDACRIYEAFQRGEGSHVDDEVLWRADGSSFAAEYWSYPIRREDRVIGAVVTFIDITERTRAAAALRLRTRAFETINRMNLALAGELDVGKIVDTVTHAATDLTGAQLGVCFHPGTDAAGAPVTRWALAGVAAERFGALGPPRPTPLLRRTFRGEGVVRLDDVTQDPRYGTQAPHHGLPAGHPPVRSYLAAPVVSRTGTVHAALLLGHAEPGVFGDEAETIVRGIAAQAAVAIDNACFFTALQKAQREAEAANRAKDEFLAVLSHELRTPMQSMESWLSVLEARDDGDERSRRAQAALRRSLDLQAAVIADLLDVSRIVSGKLTLDRSWVDLVALAHAVVNDARAVAADKRIDLTLGGDDTPVPVMGDRQRLRQVMSNLIGNALKFTPRRGAVDLRIDRAGSDARVTVRDTGIGIDAAFLPHVFDRFRQGQVGRTRQHGGLGLGLAIVHHLVEAHGGTITADSEGPDQGATFEVRLPLAGVGRDVGQSARAPDDGALLDGITVLLVEDDVPTAEALAAVLDAHGATVRLAHSAAGGLHSLTTGPADVLVSDIGMPGESGLDLIRKVRAREQPNGGRHLPALAMTGFATTEDRTAALEAGFDDHIAKPATAADLTWRVRALLASARDAR